MFAEHVALGLERHHDDVVDRRERPHQHHGAERTAPPRWSGNAGAARRGASAPPGAAAADASLVSAVIVLTAAPPRACSLRIRMITSGISSGSADMTAATPSSRLGELEGVADAERRQQVRRVAPARRR